ncbi:MAG TPA: hypothetical protein VH083_22760 [Myxococcales bacterium]|nr:hypothetical protein [Myxococcales bacterium]
MRAAFLLLLFALGLGAAGAAIARSRGPVRIQGFSISEALQMLRINRGAVSDKTALLSVRGDKALFEVRDPAGPTVLQCPLHGDLPALFAGWAATGSAAGCAAEAADDGGDVRIYDLGGQLSPPLPGEAATLSEEQLHEALYLPALQLRQGSTLSVLRPGKLAACAPGQANCALGLSAGTLFYCGELRTCAEGACFQNHASDIQPDEVAASLAFAQANEATPAISESVTATTAARFIESPPWGNIGPGAAEMAHDLRAFFDQHPRGLCFDVRGLDVERPREALLAARALAFPVFAPFDPRAPERATPLLRDLQRAALDDDALARLFPHCDLPDEQACRERRDRLGLQLRATLGKLQAPLPGIEREELPYHVGSSGPFQLTAFDSLRARLESKLEVAKSKTGRGKLTVSYQPLWPASLAERKARCTSGVCIFRSLWGAAGKPDEGFDSMVALFAQKNAPCARRLFNALAGSNALPALQQAVRVPLGEPNQCARPTALLPQGNCATPAAPYGPAPDSCGAVKLAYAEPWGHAAREIAAAAARERVAVQVVEGDGDVLLGAASNYAKADFPSLARLAGSAVSSRGKTLLESFDAGGHPSALPLLEADVAREGPAPIFVLAFVAPRSVAIPDEQAEAARSRSYLPRLLAAWSAR